ncbi:hypothetical protein LCGC14_0412220 [marine sediment metagenome]|uniref:Lysozyme n=1 Tax=marine sediment metagenome TaxID=412755 RepID=A0A0F9VFE2_9ZZZZ
MPENPMLPRELLDMIRRHEGYRARPYVCSAGKITIGVGHNLTDKGLPSHIIEELFLLDVTDAIKDAEDCVQNIRFLSEPRQNVIVDMVFNLGKTRFLKFVKFIAAVERNDFQDAAVEMLNSRWYAQVGSRAKRLRQMMLEG